MKEFTLAVKAKDTGGKISVTLEGTKGTLEDYVSLSSAIVRGLLSKFDELSSSNLTLTTAFAATMMATIKEHKWDGDE